MDTRQINGLWPEHGMESMSWDEAVATSIVNEHKHLAGATLPILHALQENFGYIDRAAIPLIAEALNVSKAEVLGTITFYHDFRSEPAGRRVIKLCRAEACQAVGCRSLEAHLHQAHGAALGSTTHCGALTLEPVYCLGNCALGPSALVDGKLVARLTTQRLDAIVAAEMHRGLERGEGGARPAGVGEDTLEELDLAERERPGTGRRWRRRVLDQAP